MIDAEDYAKLALLNFQRIWDINHDPSGNLTGVSIDHVARLFRQAYEQGRKDENEECVAEVDRLKGALKDALNDLEDCTCDDPEKGHEMTNCHVALKLRGVLGP